MSNMTPTPSFDQWLQAVDLAVSAIAGVSIHDLADQPFRDWYDDEMSPQEAAQEVLLDEGFPEELLFSLDDGDDAREADQDDLLAEIDAYLNIASPKPATAVAVHVHDHDHDDDDWGF